MIFYLHEYIYMIVTISSSQKKTQTDDKVQLHNITHGYVVLNYLETALLGLETKFNSKHE